MQDLIRKELSKASDTINAFISSPNSIAHIEKAIDILHEAFKAGNKTISCGNGGSMCDAMHFAEELSGRFRSDRPALPAMAISDPSHITCTANDYGFDSIFSRYVEAFGSKGDVLLAISTSGNSPNVIKAADAAKAKGMKVIALTGKDGGRLAGICDVEIRVPHSEFADRIQEVHIKVIHCLILGVELKLFK
ncbi:MAG: phosphoheptose isomerase [Bacteroidota bacterium]|jgi:D-sedoheptulose 7-phosphate isomerase